MRTRYFGPGWLLPLLAATSMARAAVLDGLGAVSGTVEGAADRIVRV